MNQNNVHGETAHDRGSKPAPCSKPDPGSKPPPKSLWGDLQKPTWIWAKGILFCVLGLLSAATLLLRSPGWTETALLLVTVWSFCRAYYFAFYVIEHYVDSDFRFDGLIAFLKYAFRRKS